MVSFGILIVSIVVCELVGLVSGFATVKSVKSWYKKLKKPLFNPPSSLFGPVWTTLYALMGISLYLILQSPGDKHLSVVFFCLQLGLNFLWSFIFFSWHKIGWALVEILLLWTTLVITTILFYHINILAALLFIPYISWVTFATILNGAIWSLNRKT